eukprot:1346470-Amphidinium_carterae.1
MQAVDAHRAIALPDPSLLSCIPGLSHDTATPYKLVMALTHILCTQNFSPRASMNHVTGVSDFWKVADEL